MKLNHKKIYNKFIKKYQIFGIESDFYDCSRITGPVIPEWIKGQTIYEIYVRAFSEEGTFKGVQKNLKYIKSLGIDVIWFMPIYPIGKIERKGSMGCPYSVQDYLNVNPEYGTNKDFKELVDALHDLDMRVILDLVVNHVAQDYKEFERIPKIALLDEKGVPTRKVPDWSDVVDLDYSYKETWNHVLDIMHFWIEQFDVDGFRCDVAGLISTEFWDWIVPQILAIKKDIFMLAEWESPLLHKNVFHATYDWILYSIILDVIKGKAPARDLTDWIETKKSIYPQESQFLRFLENHDKIRIAKLFNQGQLAALLIFIFTIDGIPMIYNGQEIGAEKYPSLFEKEPINWQDCNTQIKTLIKTLVLLRKNYPSLSSKNYHFIKHHCDDKVLIYKRISDVDLLIIINFNSNKITIPEHSELHLDQSKNIIFNTHKSFDIKQLFAYQGLIIKLE